MYKLGLMSLNVKNEKTKRRPSEIEDDRTKAGLEFCSMAPLQGDLEKMEIEQEKIYSRLGGMAGLATPTNQTEAARIKREIDRIKNGSNVEVDGEGLKDENALKFCFDIPDSQRTSSVWKLGAQILCDLKYFVSSEEWIRRSDAVMEGDAEAQLIFQEVRTQRFFRDVTEGLPAEVGFTIEKFRGLYAREPLSADRSVLVEEPLLFARAYSSNPEENLPACDACGKDLSSLTEYLGETVDRLTREIPPIAEDLQDLKPLWPAVEVVRCPSCDLMTFCSAACREEAWRQQHRYLCPGVNRHSKLLFDAYQELADHGKCETEEHSQIFQELSCNSTPMMLLKMWGIILSNAFQLAELKKRKVSLQEYQLACEPFRSFIGARFPFADAARPLFTCLEAILGDIDAFPTAFTLNEAEFEWRYSQIASNVQEFRPPETNLETWMRRVKESDDERLWKAMRLAIRKAPTKVQPRPPQFSGMFVLHATTNHSCNHNCKVTSTVTENGRVAIDVVALRGISSGEELCIRYADVTLPRQERRDYLHKGWGFWCMCEKCKFEGDDQNICNYCQKLAEEAQTFLACGKCKRVWYCSKECQKKNWAHGHKNVCKLSTG